MAGIAIYTKAGARVGEDKRISFGKLKAGEQKTGELIIKNEDGVYPIAIEDITVYALNTENMAYDKVANEYCKVELSRKKLAPNETANVKVTYTQPGNTDNPLDIKIAVKTSKGFDDEIGESVIIG